jgi:hypothetical protein
LTEKHSSEIDECELLTTKLEEPPKPEELEGLRSEVTNLMVAKSGVSERLSVSEKEVKKMERRTGIGKKKKKEEGGTWKERNNNEMINVEPI